MRERPYLAASHRCINRLTLGYADAVSAGQGRVGGIVPEPRPQLFLESRWRWLDTVNIGYLGLRIDGKTVGWFLMGLSLWATLQAIGTPDLRWPGDWPLTTAAVALAVVVGFASLIPGGAGVRDWVLAFLMIPRFGTATALISAFLLRMVWLVSELAISGILYKMGPDDPASESNASQQKPTSLNP